MEIKLNDNDVMDLIIKESAGNYKKIKNNENKDNRCLLGK